MDSMHPYYLKKNITAAEDLSANDATNTIIEPRQKTILSKVYYKNLSNVLESIEVFGGVTALVAYYRYIFLVSGDFLIKMETVPKLNKIKEIDGYSNTNLIAGADGRHIFVIKDGELIKLDFELEKVDLPKDAENTGWDNARLMDGSGDHLYIVESKNLIQMDAITIKEVNRDRKCDWTDATLLTVPGEGFLYIFKNGELNKLEQYSLNFFYKREWEGTTVLTGDGNTLYLVKNGELLAVNVNNLERDDSVTTDSGKENVTLMSSWIEFVFYVEND
ncbi:hypothetical protein [Bacillus cereus]|uniref:hypothetical protein n=1 Tax=Bacillus cereus TaxID=1396 RepID=UPI00397B8118